MSHWDWQHIPIEDWRMIEIRDKMSEELIDAINNYGTEQSMCRLRSLFRLLRIVDRCLYKRWNMRNQNETDARHCPQETTYQLALSSKSKDRRDSGNSEKRSCIVQDAKAYSE
ncbi:hypothetical protein [Chromatium okenii]|uniref:hypothetical protein n=1 Tax=Chromatium okenii TaxID=61644 RepID=UPI0026F16B02|nr:hypothetical protein [Chromatium okenii]MBV5310901.1 hypothetical protein [Chromatium okenii]